MSADCSRAEARKGWEAKPLRAFLRPKTLRGMPDAQLLSVTRESGVIVRDVTSKEENHNAIPEDLSNYKFVAKGQFVINKMKAWQGSYGVSPCDGIVSPAYFVYDLDFPCKAFFNLAIRSKAYVPFFQKYSKGIRVDQWDLMPEALKCIPFYFPSLPVQKAIVDYLDAKLETIDKAIASEEKMIALLQERREIIINEAVAPREGWEMRRLSQVIHSLRTGLNPRRFFELNPNDALNYYVTIREIKDGRVVFSADTDRINDQAIRLCNNRSHLEKGDILFSGTGSIGEIALVRETPTNWNIKEGIYSLKPNIKRVFAPYLIYVLASPVFLALARIKAVGTAVKSIPMKELAVLPIPLPPLPEQETIAARLDRETAKIDRAIETKRRQIALLRERREIIIDEAVTGKVQMP